MTDSLASIRALIAKWRDLRQKATDVGFAAAGTHRGYEASGVCEGLDRCIDDLQAALLAVDAPQEALQQQYDDWYRPMFKDSPDNFNAAESVKAVAVDAPPPQADILWEAFEAGHHAWPTPEQPTRRAAFERWFESARQSVAELPDWLRPSPSAPPPQAEEPWQPIETAPKDGFIIGAWPCTGAASGWDVGEVVRERGGWENYTGECSPTHWKPLPAPPTARPTRQEGS